MHGGEDFRNYFLDRFQKEGTKEGKWEGRYFK